MIDVSMTIDGELVAAPTNFGIVNPATGKIHAEAPECGREQLDQAFAAAERAQREWRIDETARRNALEAAADAIAANVDTLAPMLTAEQGKPINDAAMECRATALWLRYFAGLEIPREVIQDDERAFAEVVRKPMGVVAAITPWNFPLNLASWKIAPALLGGNTMVLKPSPYTPRSTLKMGELLNEVLPPGVLNVVSGGDDLGKWMTAHATPNKISFTGSTRTGRHIASAAAPDLKRVTLELGGNDAAIVLDDADIDMIVEKLFNAAFMNCGQVCSAIKRIYVPQSMHDELVVGLAAQAAEATVGDGMDPDTRIGPINNKAQFDRVTELVSEAVNAGATAVSGGRPVERPGYFFAPTVLAGAGHGDRIVEEEQFGPALPVLPYRNVEEAISAANDTMFGLSGSVWSSDLERAGSVADRLECGTAWVNAHVALGPHQPFGGFKWSGIGVENGPWGLASFTEVQVQYRAKT